jgi:hypothetical protein
MLKNNSNMEKRVNGMKTHLLVSIGLIILSITLIACSNRGNTDNVVIDIGRSEKFSSDEINSAMDCVIQKFKVFKGCKLTKLWYDEERSDLWTKDYAPGTAIVLLSEFDVDAAGGDGSLEPNSTYEDWSWILIRANENSNWQVKDWGY